MKVKFTLLSLLLALAATSMWAADKQNTLIVLTKDNVLHQFILADKPKVTDPAEISMEEGVLVISQMKANSTVNVYSMDGKLVSQLTAQRAGTYRLSLSSLPAGVYLVKADNITYKITKR